MSGTVIKRKENGLGWIVLDNPARRNALNLTMWRAIPRALEEFSRDPEVKVIILRGEGHEAFAAGADISEFKELRTGSSGSEEYNQATEAAFEALLSCSKPTIAMIHGFCFGGGAALAINCDLRLADRTAKISIPPAKLGIGYGYENIRRLMAVLGPARTREAIFTGRVYRGQDLLDFGFVHQMVASEGEEGALLAFTEEYAGQIANNAPLTIHSANLCVRSLLNPADEKLRQRAIEATQACYDSEDYQEGYQAFLEKRKPRFQGK